MNSVDPDRWRRAKHLFATARELPLAQRRAWLERECGSDLELLAEIEDLLREADSDDDPLPPPTIPGYELRQQLGRGGMGVVYLAWDQALQREVAIKLLRRDVLTTPEQLARFRHEPVAVARLVHPHIVPVHASGEHGAILWFAMEYVRGHDLRREVQNQHDDTGGGSPLLPGKGSPEYFAAVVRLVRDVARALHYAHDRGVVHRDIKPHNILLRAEDRSALVVDFGIAKDSQLGTVTGTGRAPGTVYYMSPEQIEALRVRVDRRTDIYSLGVVLYELLTLRRPFDGATDEQVLAAIVAARPRPLRMVDPTVPRDLELVCNKAMAKAQEQRYLTAREFAEDLDAVLSLRSPSHARPPGLWDRGRGLLARHARPLAIGGGLLLAVGGGALWQQVSVHAAAVKLRAAELRHAASIDLATAGSQQRAHAAAAAQPRPDDDSGNLELVAQVDGRLREFRDACGARARALLDGIAASGAEHPALVHTLREAHEAVFAGLDVGPRDPTLLALAAALREHSEVSLRIAVRSGGQPLAGRVSCRPIDLVTGAIGSAIELGTLPLGPRPLVPGAYRFVVETAGRPPLELTRVAHRGTLALAIDVSPQPTGADGMVRIEGGVLPADDEDDDRYAQLPGGTPVAPFLIDEAEVSVADYGRFLAASGRQAPVLWAELNRDPAHRDRPVVWVGYEDAQAFAEWHGKRLPTRAEWQWAARGSTARLFPWTDERTSDYRGATMGVTKGTSPADRLRDWVLGTHDVRSDPEARTLGTGLYHMLGNVMEWTETVHLEIQPQGRWPQTSMRVVLGGAWNVAQRRSTLDFYVRASVLPESANHQRGFRCARSLPE